MPLLENVETVSELQSALKVFTDDSILEFDSIQYTVQIVSQDKNKEILRKFGRHLEELSRGNLLTKVEQDCSLIVQIK